MPGPMGKRSDMKSGHRTKAELGNITKGQRGAAIDWPDAPEHWQTMTDYFFEALKVSGEVQYFEQSDVALAMYLLEQLDTSIAPYARVSEGRIVVDKNGEPVMVRPKVNGNVVSALLSGFKELGIAEGHRRTMKMELQTGYENEPEKDNASAEVVSMKRKLAERAANEA